jgi:hypothetical protein
MHFVNQYVHFAGKPSLQVPVTNANAGTAIIVLIVFIVPIGFSLW